jgi:cyanophycinase-like exopeptidase
MNAQMVRTGLAVSKTSAGNGMGREKVVRLGDTAPKVEDEEITTL